MVRQAQSGECGGGGWVDYPKMSAAWVADEDISRLLRSLPSWASVKKSPTSRGSGDQAQTPFAADAANLGAIVGESEQEIRERTQRESEILISNLGTQKQLRKQELITNGDHVKVDGNSEEGMD